MGVEQAGFTRGVAAACISPRRRLQGDVGVVRAGFLRRVAAARISPRGRLHALRVCVCIVVAIDVLFWVVKKGRKSTLYFKLEAFAKLS